MNDSLKTYLIDNYSEVKSDLFSAFIVRNTQMTLKKGQLGFMTPFVWMFITTHENLRNFLINKKTITSLVQLEYSGFDGATVPICTFTIENNKRSNFEGGYIKLSKFRGSENQSPKALEAINNPNCGWFYRATTENFQKLSGKPIAYWMSEKVTDVFVNEPSLNERFSVKSGIMTGNDSLYLRLWSEVSITKISLGLSSYKEMKGHWYPLSKGGDFRKWFGNNEHVINMRNQSIDIKTGGSNSRLRDKKLYFRPYITWSRISSSSVAFRYLNGGVLFADAAPGIFAESNCKELIALLNSKLGNYFLATINPTLNYQTNDIERIPAITNDDKLSTDLIAIAKQDWNAYETSWDFTTLPLFEDIYRQSSLSGTYKELRTYWQQMTDDMKRLEEKNNRIFIDAYGLQDELTPEVPLKEITLTCNPYHRYGGDKTDDELEALLLADTMRELISYAVGCMFGRYSLDKPGLILANQGDKIEQYFEQIPNPSFTPDKNNVIPILDDGWFSDDIVERFRKFIKVAFGEEQYESNMQFIEQALGKNDKPRDIRDYFLKDFYDDHVKRYKKRPIYWLFTSGSFSALIYMHRYQPDTVSIVLNDYLREFRTKLNAYKDQLDAIKISSSQSQSEKTKAQKKLDITNKMITEMEEYEREVLYPLATKQIEIDLDDGVKVNYPKFGKALKKVTGLS